MKSWTLFFSMIALVCLGIACSSGSSGEDEPTCLETLPECESAVCVGNYLRSCSDDGLHYEYEPCYPRTCKDGACTAGSCSIPGERTCNPALPGEVQVCLENMTQLTKQACSDGTSCLRGACAPDACTPDKTMCGWKSVLTCNDTGTGWDAGDCEEGQFCDETTTTCMDMDPFCIDNVQGAKCIDLSTRAQCDKHGALSTEACGELEVCVDGFCQQKVCEVDYNASPEPDVVQDIVEVLEDVTEDIDYGPELPDLDLPPLQKPPKAWVTISGGPFEEQEITFSSAKQALYIVDDADLQVSMVKSPFQLELHFVGIQEKMVGNYNSEEPGDIQVAIFFNDGTQDPDEVQWKYATIAYDVTLQQFEDNGGRVIGTFSGTLEEQVAEGAEPTGVTIEMTDGYFDVPRKL